jgi:hypothetical protein
VAYNCSASASRIDFRAGSSRDGRENFTRPSLDDQSGQAEPESWDFDESEQDFGEKRNPPKPHAGP